LVDFGRFKRTREGFCFSGMSGMSGDIPRTYVDQLAILEGRRLGVVDRAEAVHWLSHLNYYRVKLYASVFWSQEHGRYAEGTSMEDVLSY